MYEQYDPFKLIGLILLLVTFLFVSVYFSCCCLFSKTKHNINTPSSTSFRIPKLYKLDIKYFNTLIDKENLLHINDWNSIRENKDNKKYLFHYTDKESARHILHSKVIRQTKSVRSTFGRGVFLTRLDPCESDDLILTNNYNTKIFSSSIKSKCKYVFAFQLDELTNVKQLNDTFFKTRDIWRCEHDLNLNEFNFKLIQRK